VLEPVQIAAAIIRFGDQLLMVRQAGPGEEPRPREGEPTALAHGELL